MARLIPQQPVSERFLTVPGAQVYVREVGTGSPLFALHGGPDFNHNYLLPELDVLAPPFRVIYYDQRGRGKSSEGVSPSDVSLDSELDDLDRLRQSIGLEKMALLGHSFGALLAMEYAARLPHRVSHLILMNTAPGSHVDLVRFREHREAHAAANLQHMRRIAASPAFAAGDIEAEREYYMAHFSAAVRRAEQVGTIVGRLRTHFASADILKARAIEQRLYEQTWLDPGYDVVARLARASPRTLVIHGEHDLIPKQCAENIAAAVANARLEVLEGCGHFAYLEDPARVHALITSFVLQA